MRERALAEARSWIGTPYAHQMSLKGEGCDCLGLVRGVWRGCGGAEVWTLPPYSGDWAERGATEALKDGLSRYLKPVDLAAARPGDVLVFRLKDGVAAKHAAILSEGGIDDPRAAIIHAYWGRAVTESWLKGWWRRRIVAAFAFPEI